MGSLRQAIGLKDLLRICFDDLLDERSMPALLLCSKPLGGSE
jgi:hypothetical protein